MGIFEQPLILHIPHSSRAIPEGQLDRFLISNKKLWAEMDLLVDCDTEKLFPEAREGDVRLVFPWSRFFMDVERFEDDSMEPMAERGMGVLYESTTKGLPLRKPFAAAEREELLNTWYRPWHTQLKETAEKHLGKYGRAFIVDCHSFPDTPLPCEADLTPGRPDICLGTDDFHTPGALVSWSVDYFNSAGFSVELNRPYAGTMVPLDYLRKEPGVISIMIEVNRRLYGPDAERSAGTYAVIEGFLRAVRFLPFQAARRSI